MFTCNHNAPLIVGSSEDILCTRIECTVWSAPGKLLTYVNNTTNIISTCSLSGDMQKMRITEFMYLLDMIILPGLGFFLCVLHYRNRFTAEIK